MRLRLPDEYVVKTSTPFSYSEQTLDYPQVNNFTTICTCFEVLFASLRQVVMLQYGYEIHHQKHESSVSR